MGERGIGGPSRQGKKLGKNIYVFNCGTPSARNFLLYSRTSVECCIAWRSPGRNFILKFPCPLWLLLKLAACAVWNSNVSSIPPPRPPPCYGSIFKSVSLVLCVSYALTFPYFLRFVWFRRCWTVDRSLNSWQRVPRVVNRPWRICMNDDQLYSVLLLSKLVCGSYYELCRIRHNCTSDAHLES